jgi:hypothetical protein
MDKHETCVCFEGMPPCSYHYPEREAERRAAAKAAIEAAWDRYFTVKEKAVKAAVKIVNVLLALCLVCWRVIEATHLGTQRCGGPRKAVA